MHILALEAHIQKKFDTMANRTRKYEYYHVSRTYTCPNHKEYTLLDLGGIPNPHH